jgi:hypothetical protein
VWKLVFMPEAEEERSELSPQERAALHNAVVKLEQLGPALGYARTSAIRGTEGLRELRPRQGRSPWRGLYRQVGAVFVLAAVAPEAERDPRRFRWSCEAASERLDKLEEE